MAGDRYVFLTSNVFPDPQMVVHVIFIMIYSGKLGVPASLNFLLLWFSGREWQSDVCPYCTRFIIAFLFALLFTEILWMFLS